MFMVFVTITIGSACATDAFTIGSAVILDWLADVAIVDDFVASFARFSETFVCVLPVGTT
jgi:hypothetical protein